MATLVCRENRKVIFHKEKLNMDISLHNIPTTLKCVSFILHVHWEGTVSQILFFILVLDLILSHVENHDIQIYKKLPFFVIK